MSYQSIDEVQKYLAESFFARTNDAKKASGRALGTFVEIIVFYLLKAYGFQKYMSIETQLPEYGAPNLTHNVEFTLHKSEEIFSEYYANIESITSNKLISKCNIADDASFIKSGSKKIIDCNGGNYSIKNCTQLGVTDKNLYIGNFDTATNILYCNKLDKQSFAMFECKRVGKEGNAKGPQTIEKAKQGAYVARAVSSLQKVKNFNGDLVGFYAKDDGNYITDDYYTFIKRVVDGGAKDIHGFILSVGIVSNHGNWFTSNNKNKELEVLCNSYDWLLFLSDSGLVEFIKFVLESTHLMQIPTRLRL